MIFKKGDRVLVECDGRTVDAVVALASPNGRGLMLNFGAVLVGHAGMMPVLQDNDGIYRTVMDGGWGVRVIGIKLTGYQIDPDVAVITCLECGHKSHNPTDIEQRYCGQCHKFHTDWTPRA